MLEHLARPQDNPEATSPLTIAFERLDEGLITTAMPTRIEGGWILPLDKPALIGMLEDDEKGRIVLTASRGVRHECLLLFDRAYRTIGVTLVQPPSTSDATITFLRHTSFISKHVRHYDRAGAGCVERSDAFTSASLDELQGLIWRGMTIGIQRIELIP